MSGPSVGRAAGGVVDFPILPLHRSRRCLTFAFQDGEDQARAAQPRDPPSAQAEGWVGWASYGGWASEEGRDAQQGRAAFAPASSCPSLSGSRDLEDQSPGVEPTNGP